MSSCSAWSSRKSDICSGTDLPDLYFNEEHHFCNWGRSMASEIIHHGAQEIHQLSKLKRIAVDYCPQVCDHHKEHDVIQITYDHRGGARWRTTCRFKYGTFSAKIKTPDGDTSGLNSSFYLSSLEGPRDQDEIDFEFLGKDKTIVQTNYYTKGTGNREIVHQLGFDSSHGFHEFTIKWTASQIDWLVDGDVIRTAKAEEGEDFPHMPMFLYASVWNASDIDEGSWAGQYTGIHAPYVCTYKDVLTPPH